MNAGDSDGEEVKEKEHSAKQEDENEEDERVESQADP